MQPRLLIPLTTVNIDLDLCSDEFLLRTSIPNRKFQYRIMKASLNCRRVKLTDSFQAKMEAKLLQNPAVYPQDILNCKTNMISRGQLSFSWTDCFNTFLPNFCIVALIRQDYVSICIPRTHSNLIMSQISKSTLTEVWYLVGVFS